MKSQSITVVAGCAVLLLIAGCAGVPSGPAGEFSGRDAEAGSQARLAWHVSVLSESLSPRDYRHQENLDRAADYVRQEFLHAGAEVSEQVTFSGDARFRTIVARFGAPDGELIVIGAHYDSVEGSPGADDDASGVAGLIELAHLFGGIELPGGRAVELVAYAPEEPPFFGTDTMGSRAHAASLRASGRPVALAVAVDQIGYFDDGPGSQGYPSDSLADQAGTTAGDFIAIIAAPDAGAIAARLAGLMQGATNLAVALTSDPVAVAAGLAISDAGSYRRRGIPSLLITDTAPYRGSYRHTSGDTIGTLSFSRMRAVVRSLASAVLLL